jgi:sugar phosphate permease
MLRSKWTVLALIWLSLFVAYMDRVNISFALTAMAPDLHLTPALFGVVLSAFSVGYALMQIPGGALSDRFGGREVLIGALLLWSVCTGAIGMVFSIGSLVTARVALGVGEGLENGAQFKLLGAAFTSRERSTMTGLFLTALAIAPMCAAPIAVLILHHFGWRALFLAFAIPGPIVAALVYAFVPKTVRTTAQPLREIASSAWRIGVLGGRAWMLGIAYLGFNLAFWSLLGWLPTYLETQRHFAPAGLAAAASITYGSGLLGLLAIGWLGARFAHYRAQIIAAGYALAGMSLYAAFVAPNAHASVVGLSAAAFFLYGGFGPLWALALDASPSEVHGSVSGFVNFCGQIGGIFAPAAFGIIVTVTGSYAGGFGLMIGGLVLAIVALLVAGAPAPGSVEHNAYL